MPVGGVAKICNNLALAISMVGISEATNLVRFVYLLCYIEVLFALFKFYKSYKLFYPMTIILSIISITYSTIKISSTYL